MRWTIILSIFVAVSLVTVNFAEFENYQSKDKSKTSDQDTKRIITDVKISGFAPETGLNYTIETQRLHQNASEGVSKIEQPRINHSNRNGYQRKAVADVGFYHERENFIELEGNILIELVEDEDSIPIFTKTNKMILNLIR